MSATGAAMAIEGVSMTPPGMPGTPRASGGPSGGTPSAKRPRARDAIAADAAAGTSGVLSHEELTTQFHGLSTAFMQERAVMEDLRGVVSSHSIDIDGSVAYCTRHMQSLKVEIEATQRSTMLGLESTAKAQEQEIAQLRAELSSFVQVLIGRLQEVKTSVGGILVVGEARPALDAQFQAELTQQQE